MASEIKTKYFGTGLNPSSGVLGTIRQKLKSSYLANDDETTMTSVMDLQGFVHPVYKETSELLEFSVRKLSAATELVLHKSSGVSKRSA